MGSGQMTVVCVKHVKQEVPEEWDESMPLPGDIIEGLAESNDLDDEEEVFVAAKAKWELSSQLSKMSQKQVEAIWVKVRRGDSVLKLRARVAYDKCSMLHRRFTIKAATDDRHVAVLGDLTLEQCYRIQEMSRTVVNLNTSEFNKRGVKYDWKLKVDGYLPDQRCTVITSILFMPLSSERSNSIQPTTTRCMAWFTAAISSGVPLVFVNIQTEQFISNSDKGKERAGLAGKELNWGWQQNQTQNLQLVQGIRLWFMPGIREVFLKLIPEQGEERFGIDIKRTEEGFIVLFSVTKGSAADRAGLRSLYEEACAGGHLLVVSRLEGKSVMPSSVCAAGLINCCDHNEIRDTLVSAIDQMERIGLHVMAWPSQTRPYHPHPQAPCVATLRPPSDGCYSHSQQRTL